MSCHAWCTINPLMKAYHDQEWGVPLHDDRALFEFLMLEALQCGLSWDLILKKREALKEAFRGFDCLHFYFLAVTDRCYKIKFITKLHKNLWIKTVWGIAHAVFLC